MKQWDMMEWGAYRGFSGVLSVEERDGVLLPQRMTAGQLAAFDGTDRWSLRARCTAGAALDLRTDAAELALSYQRGRTARAFGSFDLYVDGVLTVSAYEASLPESGTIVYALPGTWSRIQIYLPHTAAIGISGIATNEGARLEPASPDGPDQPLMLALGDSITQGIQASRTSCTYAVMTARQLDLSLLNQGVGGHIYEAETLDPDLACRIKPEVVTIAYGTNDWGLSGSMDELLHQAERYWLKVDRLFPEAEVFVITPIWRRNAGVPKPIGSFAELQAGLRSRLGSTVSRFHLVDGLELVPHLDSMFADLVHPNDEGFAHYAAGLAKRIAAVRDGRRG